jgi:hypothetical protein
MRIATMICCLCVPVAGSSAELESRVLTHYVPQDFLEAVVRKEGWTELPLNVKGGLRKGDVIRIWSGGLIDRGDANQPGQNVVGPAGPGKDAADPHKLALSTEPSHVFSVLFKAEEIAVRKCSAPGNPLEIPVPKDGQRLWVGFNDVRGAYRDNHLGRGRRHELDPFWMRIEVVRIIVD